MTIFAKNKNKETLNVADFNKDGSIFEAAVNWEDGERRLEQIFVDQSLVKISDAPEVLKRAIDKWFDETKTPLFMKKIYTREQVLQTTTNRETWVIGFKFTYAPVMMGAIFDVYDSRAQFAMEVNMEKTTGIFEKVSVISADDLYRYVQNVHMVSKVPTHCAEKIRKSWEEIFKYHEKYVGKVPVAGEVLANTPVNTDDIASNIEKAIKSGKIENIGKAVGDAFRQLSKINNVAGDATVQPKQDELPHGAEDIKNLFGGDIQKVLEVVQQMAAPQVPAVNNDIADELAHLRETRKELDTTLADVKALKEQLIAQLESAHSDVVPEFKLDTPDAEVNVVTEKKPTDPKKKPVLPGQRNNNRRVSQPRVLTQEEQAVKDAREGLNQIGKATTGDLVEQAKQ